MTQLEEFRSHLADGERRGARASAPAGGCAPRRPNPTPGAGHTARAGGCGSCWPARPRSPPRSPRC